MTRRLALILFLALILGSGLPALVWPGAGTAQADGNDDSGRDDSGGDDGGGDDDGGDDGGDDSDDNSGRDDSDDDDDGGDDSGSGSGSGSGSDGDDGADDDGDSVDDGAAAGSGTNRGNADAAARDLFRADGLRRIFADGSAERLVQGRYERLDRRGRVIESRKATPADRTRLTRLDREARQAGVQAVITVNRSQRKLVLTDIAGWTEILDRGIYQLRDPNGNLVTRRTASAKDIRRLKVALGLR